MERSVKSMLLSTLLRTLEMDAELEAHDAIERIVQLAASVELLSSDGDP